MTVQRIEAALERINAAGADSPIALFGTNRRDRVDACFAETAQTRYRIRHDQDLYIGSYCRESPDDEVKRDIRRFYRKKLGFVIGGRHESQSG
jgi:hypothetical protein